MRNYCRGSSKLEKQIAATERSQFSLWRLVLCAVIGMFLAAVLVRYRMYRSLHSICCAFLSKGYYLFNLDIANQSTVAADKCASCRSEIDDARETASCRPQQGIASDVCELNFSRKHMSECDRSSWFVNHPLSPSLTLLMVVDSGIEAMLEYRRDPCIQQSQRNIKSPIASHCTGIMHR